MHVFCTPIGPVQDSQVDKAPGLACVTLSRDTGKQTFKVHLLASVCLWRLLAPGIGYGWPLRGRAGEALVSAHPSERPTEGHSDG